jgi:hypothetical protein
MIDRQVIEWSGDGRPYARPTRRPLYFGSIPDTAKPSLKLSVARM